MGYEYCLKYGINPKFWESIVIPAMLNLANNECEVPNCSSTKNLHVHHTNYNIQTINTFVVLCASCHKQTHLGKLEIKPINRCEDNTTKRGSAN